MRILNLYAGIGGNRALWGDDHAITAIESNREIANTYKELFPNDNVIICDAHQYLVDNHQDFDFIWTSPPCPTHSRASTSLKGYGIYRYPDMRLYEEIIFLKHFFKGHWAVENVTPYYKPLINPEAILDRHFIWSNFSIKHQFIKEKGYNVNRATKEILSESHGITLPLHVKDKRKLLRNAVSPKIGKMVLESLIGAKS